MAKKIAPSWLLAPGNTPYQEHFLGDTSPWLENSLEVLGNEYYHPGNHERPRVHVSDSPVSPELHQALYIAAARGANGAS